MKTDSTRQTSDLLNRTILTLFLALTLLGCGGRDRGNVEGKVTFQGKPVSEGQVVFYYYDGAYGVFVPATLNTDGTFSLRTPDGPGLPTGEYDVAVTPPRVEPKMGETQVTVKPYPNIPERYRKPKTSGLTAKVEQKNEPFLFDLKP